MNQHIFSFLLVLGLSAACRLGGESSAAAPVAQPVAKPAATPTVAPMMLVRPSPEAETKPSAASVAKSSDSADSRDDRIAAITTEFDEAMKAYYAARSAAMGDNTNPTEEESMKIQEQVHAPDSEAFIARVQKLLDEDATDMAAFRAIQWLFDHAGSREEHKPLLALLEKHHFDRPEMADMCGRFEIDGRGLLEKLLAHSPHRAVRGRACMTLADAMRNDIENAEVLKSDNVVERTRVEQHLGVEGVAALKKLNIEETKKGIEACYERAMNEFGDVKLSAWKRETTLGKQASAALFEIHNLTVGKPAPEIEGSDLDKAAFKLSDYRGKIVLLDFWGNW